MMITSSHSFVISHCRRHPVDSPVFREEPKFLPKIQIDLAGYVTISMGSDLFQDKLKKSKLNWKNQEL